MNTQFNEELESSRSILLPIKGARGIPRGIFSILCALVCLIVFLPGAHFSFGVVANGLEAPIPVVIFVILLLGGFSVALSSRGITILSFTSGLLLFLIGLGACVQILLGESFGIEDLFFQNPLSAQEVDFRLSAGDAMVILVLGFSFLGVAKWAEKPLGSLTVVLGACFGLLMASLTFLVRLFEDDFLGGALPRILPNPAYALIGLALSASIIRFGLINRRKRQGAFNIMPVVSGLIFLVPVVFGWAIGAAEQASFLQQKILFRANQTALSITELLAIHNRLAKNMVNSLPAGNGGLAAGQFDAWKTISRQRAKEIGDVSEVELLSAKGEVRWKEKIRDYQKGKLAESAAQIESKTRAIQSALRSKRIQYSKITDVQDGVGTLYLVTPLLSAEGVVTDLLCLKFLFMQFLLQLPSEDGFFARVSDAAQSGFVIEGLGNAAPDYWSASAKVPSIKVNWRVALTPTEEWIAESQSNVPSWVLVLGSLLALLVAMIAQLRGEQKPIAPVNDYQGGSDVLAKIVPVGSFVASGSGEFLSVNPAWSIVTTLPAESSLGYGWLLIMGEEERTNIMRSWQEGVNSRNSFLLSFLLTAGREEGVPYQCLVSPLPFSLAEGPRFVGVISKAQV